MIELFLRPAVLGPAVAIVAFIVHQFVIATLQRPKLPVVGSREGDWFPFYQAAIRNTLDFKSAVLEAEEKYREQTWEQPRRWYCLVLKSNGSAISQNQCSACM
jgi:hypothetical protein